MSAPRSGPEVRPQAIGGPAWRNWPGCSPSSSEAGATSTSVAWLSSTASTARWFAAWRSGSVATTARSSAVPAIGGCHSTRSTGTPCASTAVAKWPAPAETRPDRVPDGAGGFASVMTWLR